MIQPYGEKLIIIISHSNMHFVMGKINDRKYAYLLKQVRKVLKNKFGHFMLSLVFTGGKG